MLPFSSWKQKDETSDPSDRRMERKFEIIKDRPTERQTDRPTDRHTDMSAHKEVSLQTCPSQRHLKIRNVNLAAGCNNFSKNPQK